MKTRNGMSGKSTIVVVFFVFILLSLTLVAGWWMGKRSAGAEPALGAVGKSAPASPLRLAPASTSNSIFGDDRIANVTEASMPAVVNVFSEKVVRQMPMNNPFFRFFGGPEMRPQKRLEQSLGSGVIVTADGYILTNNHVVDGADSIKIATADKRTFEARVIGADPMTDLAVVKIDAKDLPTLVLGDSDRVRVGQVVLAIGDPFGLSGTVTMGIVSARGRSQMGITDYEDFIQTDAAINPGNSGGALIDLRGELIGINTAIFSQSGGSMGIGFAIPSNIARKVMESLIAHGSVKRGYMGVSLQDLTPQLATQFGMTDAKGALVADVMTNSPAAQAGLEPGDVIVGIGGKPIAGYSDLRNKISDLPPGVQIDVAYVRQGVTNNTKITLLERPSRFDGGPAGATPQDTDPGVTELLGMKVTSLTADIADQLGLRAVTPGVAVVDLQPGGPADRAGVMIGDVIFMVNKQPVQNADDFRQAVQDGTGQGVLFHLSRRGQSIFLLVPLK